MTGPPELFVYKLARKPPGKRNPGNRMVCSNGAFLLSLSMGLDAITTQELGLWERLKTSLPVEEKSGYWAG